jgi:hypothetical protein
LLHSAPLHSAIFSVQIALFAPPETKRPNPYPARPPCRSGQGKKGLILTPPFPLP